MPTPLVPHSLNHAAEAARIHDSVLKFADAQNQGLIRPEMAVACLARASGEGPVLYQRNPIGTVDLPTFREWVVDKDPAKAEETRVNHAHTIWDGLATLDRPGLFEPSDEPNGRLRQLNTAELYRQVDDWHRLTDRATAFPRSLMSLAAAAADYFGEPSYRPKVELTDLSIRRKSGEIALASVVDEASFRRTVIFYDGIQVGIHKVDTALELIADTLTQQVKTEKCAPGKYYHANGVIFSVTRQGGRPNARAFDPHFFAAAANACTERGRLLSMTSAGYFVRSYVHGLEDIGIKPITTTPQN